MSYGKTASFDFSGHVVLVTGGGSGIGLAIATDFANAGAHVVISGRNEARLDQAVTAIDGSVEAIAMDVGKSDDVQRLVKTIIERHGRLDVVVSNAAAFTPGDIGDVALDDWEQLRQTNIDGFVYLAKATLPLLEKTGGSFIATSSVSGLRGDWGQSIYNASKGAVSLFVQSLALDWGSRGVRVNAVAPALTDTEAVAMVTQNDDLLELFKARIPLGRIGQSAEIAPAVLFLASDAARYVTGVILPVDGGTMASTGQARPPQA